MLKKKKKKRRQFLREVWLLDSLEKSAEAFMQDLCSPDPSSACPFPVTCLTLTLSENVVISKGVFCSGS